MDTRGTFKSRRGVQGDPAGPRVVPDAGGERRQARGARGAALWTSPGTWGACVVPVVAWGFGGSQASQPSGSLGFEMFFVGLVVGMSISPEDSPVLGLVERETKGSQAFLGLF